MKQRLITVSTERYGSFLREILVRNSELRKKKSQLGTKYVSSDLLQETSCNDIEHQPLMPNFDPEVLWSLLLSRDNF